MATNRHRTLYEGREIVKYYNAGTDKGDHDYETWEERKDTIFPVRFFLEDVMSWSLYKDPYEIYAVQATKQVLRIQLTSQGGREESHIVEDLDVFDMLMAEVIKKENLK